MTGTWRDLLRCRFNRTVVDATLSGTNLLHCVAPPHARSRVDVEISVDGHAFSTSGIQFEFQTVQLFGVSPARGPITGNTSIHVSSQNIQPPCSGCTIPQGLWCKFGESDSVPAYLESVDLISCVTPARASAGTVSLHVINNQATYITSLEFDFYDVPALEMIHPKVAVAAGTRVLVNGLRFFATDQALCKFGSSVVVGFIVSSTVVQCDSPLLLEGYHSVQVSLNGQNFHDDAIALEVVKDLELQALEPAAGPQTGGTHVTIMGMGFSEKAAILGYLHCVFGTEKQSGVFVSAEEVACVAPENKLGFVEVRVTQNDQQYSDGLFYEYRDT
eukprot:1641410-Prymnesium_polylepis.1